MNKPLITLTRISSVYLLVLFLSACTPVIGPYSPIAYQNATSLKPQTLALMDKAQKPYVNHHETVESIIVELQKAHEFVKGVPSNSISAKQWEKLIKKDGDLLGKFVKRWEEKSTLSETFIGEFKGIVSDAFDEIICLEANKKEASKCGANEGE